MRITIDANIWVPAFNFGGVAQRILDKAESGLVEVATSEAIVNEVLDVLGRKFDWSEPELRDAHGGDCGGRGRPQTMMASSNARLRPLQP